jgi:hypothetical protein
MYISTSDKAGYNNIITVFGDFRRFSAIFGDFRRFSAIFANFRRKKWRLSLKNNAVIQFWQKIAVICTKTPILMPFLGNNIKKIRTLVPKSIETFLELCLKKDLGKSLGILFHLVQLRSGLPDFSWYMIPKLEKYTK